MNVLWIERTLGIAAIALLGITVVTGQTNSRPTTPGSGSSPSVPTTPSPTTRTTIPGQTPGQTQQTPDFQRPMFMSGKVMLDDGNPPPDSVRIERVCGGRVIPEANTDRKGRFSFQLGQNSSMLADASDSGGFRGAMGSTSATNPAGGIRERDLIGCELRAALPGFRSDVVNLANRKFMDNPEVGTIILHRMGNVEGLTISATSLNAPKDAKKFFDKGKEALKKDKPEEAQKDFEKAVEAYPKYATAWYELGALNDRQKNTEAARKAYAEAINADAKYMSPYDGLAFIQAREQKWQDVADTTDRMIRMNPVDFPRAFYLNAVAKLNLKRLDEAEKSAKQLVEMDTRHQFPKGEQVLGVILAQKQDYSGAATHLKKFVEISQPGSDVEMVKKQLAELEKTLAAREQNQ